MRRRSRENMLFCVGIPAQRQTDGHSRIFINEDSRETDDWRYALLCERGCRFQAHHLGFPIMLALLGLP